MARYATLAQLQEAYAGDGELDGTSVALGNDTCYVYAGGVGR
jgi:hypothetical protein